MRYFILGMVVSLITSWASATIKDPKADSAFPVDHIKYIDGYSFEDEVEMAKGKVVVIFSNGSCLWTSYPARSCFLFEKRIDFFGKQIKSRGYKLIGIDVGFRNIEVFQRYSLTSKPSVIIFNKGYEVERFEPRYSQQDRAPYVLSWQDDLTKRVIDFLQK